MFRKSALIQSLLLGLLLIFIFSLAMAPGQKATPQEAAAIFWISSLFFETMIFNQLFQIEENTNARLALIMTPLPVQGIWLGKSLAGLAFILIAQALFLPAIIVFLNQAVFSAIQEAALGLILIDTGIAALGSLLGATAQGSGSRDSLLSLVLFPLLAPLLMAAINIYAALLGAEGIALNSWLGLALAFDGIFISACLLLFGFVYTGES